MKMRINILDELSRRGEIFTFDDAYKISNVDRSILKVLLNRLKKQGWIERIEKGKYMIIPLGAKKSAYTLNGIHNSFYSCSAIWYFLLERA